MTCEKRYVTTVLLRISKRIVSEKLGAGIYLGISFVDGLCTEYLKTKKVFKGEMKKIQRLKNTSFEIVDIS